MKSSLTILIEILTFVTSCKQKQKYVEKSSNFKIILLPYVLFLNIILLFTIPSFSQIDDTEDKKSLIDSELEKGVIILNNKQYNYYVISDNIYLDLSKDCRVKIWQKQRYKFYQSQFPTWTGSCINGYLSGYGTLTFTYAYDQEYIQSSTGERGLSKKGSIYTVYKGYLKRGEYNGQGELTFMESKFKQSGIFKDNELYNGKGIQSDGTLWFTVTNGVKKLSSAAERIAKLESQLKNNRTEIDNDRIQNKRNQDEQEKRNNLNRPCKVRLDRETDWNESMGNYYKTYDYTLFKPNETGGYDEIDFEIDNWHRTPGILRSNHEYSWDVSVPFKSNKNFKNKSDAIIHFTEYKGCNSIAY